MATNVTLNIGTIITVEQVRVAISDRRVRAKSFSFHLQLDFF